MKSAAQKLSTVEPEVLTINVNSTYYKELNQNLRRHVLAGVTAIELKNVFGQRYIGTNLQRPVKINIYGTPGNDLGAFMDGPMIEIFGNAQDGVANTMNSGEITVHGSAGDVLGMSMRGGEVYVRGNVGYRCGIHMKEYGDKKPLVIIGGTSQDFFGEYMAGGTVVILGLNLKDGEPHRANFVGTGMHGGRIFMRGHISPQQLGKEVGVTEPDAADREIIEYAVRKYVAKFGGDTKEILSGQFSKLYPKSLRPYGRLYAY